MAEKLARVLDFISKKTGISLKILRFLISGGTTTVTEITLLYVLTELGLWYVFSLIVAFVVALLVSFTMQKFWTFENNGFDRISVQAPFYFINALGNLAVNAALLFVLVEYFQMWYLSAQIGVAGLIAIWNFSIYKFYIFRIEERKSEPVN